MIKKSAKIFAVLMVICLMICSLTACTTKLSGTYTSEEGLVKQSFTFKEDNVVEMSAFGIDVEGTYKIEDDKITITYKLLNLSYDWEKDFEKNGNTITIDGTDFVKEN